MANRHDLNSLSRFRKQGGRLILEEHGHCEVPAGCGGVVLRWRNPLAAVPFIFRLYTAAAATCFLDGGEVHNARVDLAPGDHAVAFVIENVDLSAGLILFATVHPDAESEGRPLSSVTETPVQVLTADDGTWKCSLDHPATDDWKSATFDDHDWLALTRAPTPQLSPEAPGVYQCGECVDRGAISLGLPAGLECGPSWWQRLLGARAARPKGPVMGSVWIRKVFIIPIPQFREPG